MEFLEKDLENIIWEADNKILREKGLPIDGKKYRQLRIGNYGISDIITASKNMEYSYAEQEYYSYLDITVYELKKEKVGIGAFLQAIKYCKGIQSYLNEKKPDLLYKINIVLLAKSVDLSGEFIYITDLFPKEIEGNFKLINGVSFYSFNYDINGITFKEVCNYNLIDKGF